MAGYDELRLTSNSKNLSPISILQMSDVLSEAKCSLFHVVVLHSVECFESVWGLEEFVFDVEYIYGFVWWGGLQAKSMTSQRYRARSRAVTRWRMCYYGNVMTTTRWWLCVTMETLFYIFNSTVIDWTCFSLQNAVYFIMLPFLVPVLFTF